MTTGLHISHAFVSAKSDGTDQTLVKPSDWNADHQILMDSGYILGNQSGANGPAQQIALTAFIAALLGAPDFATLNTLGFSFPTTGDVKPTYKPSPDPGWILLDDGTIGNAASGATSRANADCQNLFNLLYLYPDSSIPLLTSTGAATTRTAQGTAATAWGNGCRISLPKVAQRALLAAGTTGAGLSTRYAASYAGEENHTLATSELPAHTHGVSMTSSGSANTGTESANHTHTYSGTSGVENQTITFSFSGTTGGMNSADPHSHNFSDAHFGIVSSISFYSSAFNTGSGIGGGGSFGPGNSASIASTSINHSHPFSGTTGGQNNNHNHSYSGTTAIENVSHYHAVNVTVSGNTTTDNGTGGSGPHNNMQPFASMYVWIKL